MKLSVAMTTYNGEKYIDEQLESLRFQKRKIDELIICDDGSADGTPNLITDYIKKNKLEHWQFIVNEQNKGFIGNFFQAIKKTSGDLIFTCDQDDIWQEDKLKEMEKKIQNTPQIQALNTAVRLVDNQGANLYVKKKRGYCNANILHSSIKEGELKSFSFDFLVKSNISPGCTMCFTKDLKEKFLTYEELCVKTKFPHDWFLNMLASLDNGCYYWNKEFTGYRIHESNTIGVETGDAESLTQVKSTKELREEIGKFHVERANFLNENLPLSSEQKKYIQKYLEFTEKRYEFLQNLSFGKLCTLYKYTEMYYNAIGFKGMVSDFLYGLKMDDLFRRGEGGKGTDTW